MISPPLKRHMTAYYGTSLFDYFSKKKNRSRSYDIIIFSVILSLLALCIIVSKPIFATDEIQVIKESDTGKEIYLQKNFEENIKNKYTGSYINFPAKGIAHIKQVKYINSKPIKINIVEINTKVNPNLKVKPSTASQKLNSKSTVRKIALKQNSIIAINASFFKPQSGVPLGALMIDKEVLTGPIYNRVGMAIFDKDDTIQYKMSNISFNISATTNNHKINIDNINQPRMLSTHILLYTHHWAKFCPTAPKNGWNMLIRQNKIIGISANPMEMQNGDMVIQAPKDIISKIGKEDYIKVNIKLQDELQDATHIIGAGPYLVKNSQIYVDYKEQKLTAISGKNPRSAVGYKNDGTLVIVTIDGREQNSVGMTLYELAKLMKNIGCVNAMNFDGGSSSAMYVNGKIVNNAVNREGIAVSNALVVYENSNLAISSL